MNDEEILYIYIKIVKIVFYITEDSKIIEFKKNHTFAFVMIFGCLLV